MTNDLDLDLDAISGIDGANTDALFLRIKDRTSGDFAWHWVARDVLAGHGLHELAEHGQRRWPVI